MASFEESRLFKNEEVLYPEYLPEILPHRENQIQLIASNLSPIAEKRKPQNSFIFGSPGIGKTASIKFVFRQFEEYSGIKSIYINCWDYKTELSILTKIALELNAFVQRRGVAKDEVLERLIEALKKSGKGLVVCLDEVDQLIFNDKNALYDLLRINQYVDNPVGLVFISNNPLVFSKVEPRTKSSLNIEEIEFKPYTFAEMKNILSKRASFAIRNMEEGVIGLCANHAVNNGGDVRIGLECLLKSAKIAERENAEKIKVIHAKKVIPEIGKVKPKIIEQQLSEEEKKILAIVKTKKFFSANELYEKYSKISTVPVSERTFSDFLDHLGELKMIKSRIRKWGIQGKTRVISKNL